MKRTVCFLALLPLVACSGSGGEQGPAGGSDGGHVTAHWGYEEDDGPEHWGQLSEDWATCSTGRRQSPIDLAAAAPGDVPVATMSFPQAKLIIKHQSHVLEALDNGHTIQVNYDGGETLSLDDRSYSLLQYHFHSPSEHTVDGKHYPMEMHLVHQTDSGELAVIGVFLEEGKHNAAFDALWQHLPDQAGEQVELPEVQSDIDALLPASRTSYRYQGSLTTPPCSEGVRWIVMTEPVQLGADQISAFREIFHGNNRPPQRLNGREVIMDGLAGA